MPPKVTNWVPGVTGTNNPRGKNSLLISRSDRPASARKSNVWVSKDTSRSAMVVVATVTTQGIGKQLCPDVNDFQEMAKFVLPILMKRGEAIPDSDEARAAQAALAE